MEKALLLLLIVQLSLASLFSDSIEFVLFSSPILLQIYPVLHSFMSLFKRQKNMELIIHFRFSHYTNVDIIFRNNEVAIKKRAMKMKHTVLFIYYLPNKKQT